MDELESIGSVIKERRRRRWFGGVGENGFPSGKRVDGWSWRDGDGDEERGCFEEGLARWWEWRKRPVRAPNGHGFGQ